MKIAIVGAGGFAREVEWLIRDISGVGKSRYDFRGFLVSDIALLTDHDSRPQVLGNFDVLNDDRHGIEALALGIGNPQARKKLAAELSSRFPKLAWPALVHPSVRMDFASCTIGHGVVLCAGTIGTVHLRLEAFCMVNLACTIGHEAVIGGASVMNPTVNISGGVELGESVLIGTGAQILQYVKIGAGATVGAGAVVTKNVEPGVIVAGVPAKPLAAKA